MNSSKFYEALGYEFQDPSLLEQALTHSSFVNEDRKKGISDNERLEFLGDAVFDAVISERLYKDSVRFSEGRLTRIRARVVCERSLAECALKLGVGEHLYLGRGEERSGGRTRQSLIADAMEAIIGAVYLDGGWEAATEFVLRIFDPVIEEARAGRLRMDYKTELQELLQIHGSVEIHYQMDREEGPDHDKVFYMSIWSQGKRLGEGSGKSKKEAEQAAAKQALEQLKANHK
ncbi:MAG: ribonuclease III [Clostridiales bacterium]|nr:ribonuclease III [Clostridiales bacterium]